MKKIVVTLGAIKSLEPTEKVAKIREIKTTCDGSDAFNASTACQSAMTAWQDLALRLEKKHATRVAKEAELQKAIDEEQEASTDCDGAGTIFADTVVVTAKGDPAIVREMGLTVRADREPVSDVGVVSGVRITQWKSSGAPKLTWDEMPGVALYRAEMSEEPASDSSWALLYGRGMSRKVPPLVSGKRYSFRVCAIGFDGRSSAWSAVVTFVAA